MRMSFFIKWNGRVSTPTTEWESIFRLGWPATAGGCATQNSRYPSLWIDDVLNEFHLSISDDNKPPYNGNCGRAYELKYTIQPSLIYKMSIEFDTQTVNVTINDTFISTPRAGPTRASFLEDTMDPLNVYIASDYYNEEYIIADVILWDISIESVLPPSISPTTMPTNTPTFPSKSPTEYPTNPTNTPSLSPSTPTNTVW